MIQRKDYLNQLISWKGEKVIKVVTLFPGYCIYDGRSNL